MMLAKNISLLNYNTFHIEASASRFLIIESLEELESIHTFDFYDPQKCYIIGGGSNILLTQNIEGLVLLNRLKGIDILEENDHRMVVKFMGGENWHDCVLWSIERNLGGIENLSLIPGTIGAAPIQNIGAYGVELKEVFLHLEAIELSSGKKKIFSKEECQFGYRNSIFKSMPKNQFMITAVVLEFSKQPNFITTYGNVKEELTNMGVKDYSVKAISDAIIRIRQRKLPDPAVIGNAGSFFKNPVISKSQWNELITRFPGMPSYSSGDEVKIPAAWLIEKSGPDKSVSWKGYREGDAGVHANQPLCLVNYSKASGKQIYDLSTKIITNVQHVFNISLEREVNIW